MKSPHSLAVLSHGVGGSLSQGSHQARWWVGADHDIVGLSCHEHYMLQNALLHVSCHAEVHFAAYNFDVITSCC